MLDNVQSQKLFRSARDLTPTYTHHAHADALAFANL